MSVLLYTGLMNSAEPILPINQYQRLGVKTFWLSLSERLSFSMGFLFLAVVAIVATRLTIVPPEVKPLIIVGEIVFFAIFIISFGVGFISSYLTYKNHLFCLATDAFKIKRGVFTQIETAFPYRQIQNVEIERKLIFRMLGLSKLVIITAGHDNPNTLRNEAEGVLPMIEKEIADALQEELIRRSDIQRTMTTRVTN